MGDPAVRDALRKLELEVTRRLMGRVQGEYRGILSGPGTEPGDSRVYVPGDDVRLMDWSVTARTTVPHVRDPVQDNTLDVWLLVDLSASQRFGTIVGTKWDVAVLVAAAFAIPASRRANRVGAVIVQHGPLNVVPLGSGEAWLFALLHRLSTAPLEDGGGRTDLRPALARTERLARRRGVVVVVSDFLVTPGWERSIGRLAARHEVVVAEIVDRRELELPDVGVIALQDPETGAQRFVDTSSGAMRDRFHRAADDQRAAIANAISRSGAEHIVIRTDHDWVGELLVFFRRRQQRHSYRTG